MIVKIISKLVTKNVYKSLKITNIVQNKDFEFRLSYKIDFFYYGIKVYAKSSRHS